jgi:hypothetical protein
VRFHHQSRRHADDMLPEQWRPYGKVVDTKHGYDTVRGIPSRAYQASQLVSSESLPSELLLRGSATVWAIETI